MTTTKRRHKVRFLSTLMAFGLGLATWFAGTPLSLQAAPSGNVGIRLHILNPPNSITDLSAAPVGTASGDVQLAWTAPGNNNGIAIDQYLIRFATFPAPSVAQADAWWSNAVASQIQINTAFSPGTQEFTTIQGLTVGVTYYFGIKSVDNDGSVSPIDERVGLANQAQTQPLDITGTPSTPSNFAGVALSATQIQWTWNAVTSAGFYTLYDFPSDALVASTAATTLIENNLSINTAYSRRLRAVNGNGMSNATAVQTIFTLAQTPAGLGFVDVNFTDITLSWTANGNPSGTQYRLERSQDGVNYVIAVQTTGVTYQDTGLSEETTYYYRIRSLNGDGIQTNPTIAISTFTQLQLDFVAPKPPMGLKGTVDSSHRAFTLTWESPLQNTDGSPVTDLAGYHVYRRTTLLGARSLITPVPLTIAAFADQVDGQTFYYTVTAIDTSGNESTESLFTDSSIDTNVIFLSTDTISSVFMPDKVNDLLRSAHNKYGVPLSIGLNEQPIPTGSNIARHIRITLIRGDNGQTINDLAFAEPQSIVAIGYNLSNGQVVVGSPRPTALEAQSPTVMAATPNDLSMYWHNGVTWVKVGGTLDEAAQAIKTRTSFLGDYQLRIVSRATSLNLEQANVYPRVFSPNGDGFNDRVYFVLENPNDADVKGEIFDMAGRLVATLPPPSGTTGIGTTLIWDGKDLNGAVAPSGVYVYRIEGEGKTFTGTVAIAR